MMQRETKALGAEYCKADAVQIEGSHPDFRLLTRSRHGDREYRAQTVLFATGVARKHPLVGGEWRNWLPYAARNGTSFYCGDCEAPETAGKDILIVNAGTTGSALHAAASLKRFAGRIRVFMTEDAFVPFTELDRGILDASGLDWTSGIIDGVEVEAPGTRQILATRDGRRLECQHFFVAHTAIPRSELAASIGVARNETECILTDHRGKTDVEGIWAAGDVRAVSQQIGVAVGTGNYAAVMINQFVK